MPLTPNGKIDLQALPSVDESKPKLNKSFVAPRTPAEQVIADIWARVLKLDQVGIHDNFFDLGGHSLSAIQVISRVCETFQLEFPLRCLFEHPTIAGLGVQITEAQAKNVVPEDVATVLADLDALSEEETQCLLTQEKERVDS
jgi:acyl carrier protein